VHNVRDIQKCEHTNPRSSKKTEKFTWVTITITRKQEQSDKKSAVSDTNEARKQEQSDKKA
jgi:hypothetical protein